MAKVVKGYWGRSAAEDVALALTGKRPASFGRVSVAEPDENGAIAITATGHGGEITVTAPRWRTNDIGIGVVARAACIDGTLHFNVPGYVEPEHWLEHAAGVVETAVQAASSEYRRGIRVGIERRGAA